ncbi:MAG: hypothetical protein JWN44_1209 [Myxococcales bacterium]|nr:hypothetical protein [Myxococcales bacterium]
MSVALLITKEDDEAHRRLIPVATQQVFRTRWLRGARSLDLPLVASMETGCRVDVDNRNQLIDELSALRNWMQQEFGAASYDIERLDRLVDELRLVEFAPGLEVFVG